MPHSSRNEAYGDSFHEFAMKVYNQAKNDGAGEDPRMCKLCDHVFNRHKIENAISATSIKWIPIIQGSKCRNPYATYAARTSQTNTLSKGIPRPAESEKSPCVASLQKLLRLLFIACGIDRVFVAHNLTSDRGYATHRLRLCHWVILVSDSKLYRLLSL